MQRRIIFLPGASGLGSFWEPVARLLPDSAEKVFLDWPGLGTNPDDPGISDYAGLVDLVLRHIERPVDVVAQSLGGIVALHLALAKPELVERMVLVSTPGGIDFSQFGIEDWRVKLASAQPNVPGWVVEERGDLSSRLRLVDIPILLIWGESDQTTPLAVGRRLCELLPRGEIVVLRGAGHTHARDNPDGVVQYIVGHLGL